VAAHGEIFALILRAPIDLRLPDAPPGSTPDVDIEVRALRGRRSPARSHFAADVGEIVADEVGAIRVEGGRSIVVRAVEGASEGAIVHFLTGPALGLILHQRRNLVLHASGVVSPRHGVLFVGDSGWGKSTIAAACMGVGAEVITDDIAPLEFGTDTVTTLGGPPWIKLWPDAVGRLRLDRRSWEPIYSGQAKVRVPIALPKKRVPIDVILVIAHGERDSLADVAPQEAFVELTRHSYAAAVLERTDSQGWHADAVGETVRSVPVRRMTIGLGAEDLGARVLKMIESLG
jgi:hypothetical protein